MGRKLNFPVTKLSFLFCVKRYLELRKQILLLHGIGCALVRTALLRKPTDIVGFSACVGGGI
jgi:hypothetical protein